MKNRYQKAIEAHLPFLISLLILAATCATANATEPLPAGCLSSPDGDVNYDCTVDYWDLQQMANEWLVGLDPNSDLDDDNDVDFNDFAILANYWQNNNLLPLVFHSDFEDANLAPWQATDPNAWRIDANEGNPGNALSLFAASVYTPPFTSPSNINLIKNVNVTSFVLELDMLSTTPYVLGRDLCLFFGYQDPSHFYYAHISDTADNVHNTIHIVNNAARASIADYRNSGNSLEGGWHKVRLLRDVDKGTIEVYFDDMNEAVMTAVDSTFDWGKVGVGSFNDAGQFDNIHLYGQ